MLPGGSGTGRTILTHLGGPATSAFSPASRVSLSELLSTLDLIQVI